MGHERPRDAEYARVAFERSALELRQLPVIAGWEISADLADLGLDDVVVVQQPLRGRNNGVPALDLRGAGAICRKQNSSIVAETCMQRYDGCWGSGNRLR